MTCQLQFKVQGLVTCLVQGQVDVCVRAGKGLLSKRGIGCARRISWGPNMSSSGPAGANTRQAGRSRRAHTRRGVLPCVAKHHLTSACCSRTAVEQTFTSSHLRAGVEVTRPYAVESKPWSPSQPSKCLWCVGGAPAGHGACGVVLHPRGRGAVRL